MPPIAKPTKASPGAIVERAFRVEFDDTTARVQVQSLRHKGHDRVHTVMVKLTASGVDGALVSEVPTDVPSLTDHARVMAKAARAKWHAEQQSPQGDAT